MRILQGTSIVEAGPGWRASVRRPGRRVVVDLGAGDGRYAYEGARRDPGGFYVAVDPDAATLSEYAYRASRRPARGGIENAAFVVASVEDLPAELGAVADLVRVNFPWSSLLRGLLRPEPAVLRAMASLLAASGRFELVLCYDPRHDPGAFPGEALPPLDAPYLQSILVPAYLAQGLAVDQYSPLAREEALALPSTWGRRLLHGRARDVYFVAGALRV